MLPVLFDPELPVGMSLTARRHPNCLVTKVQGVQKLTEKMRWGWDGSAVRYALFPWGSRLAFFEPSSYSWKSRQFVTRIVLVKFINFKENVQEDCQVI